MTEPSAPDIMSQHIGWLRQYIVGMTEANWADMRMRAERQLHELAAALRAAPAQGEPVAWRYGRKDWNGEIWRVETFKPNFETVDDWVCEPLYAAPQPAVSPVAWGEILESFKGGYLTLSETIEALESGAPSSPAPAPTGGTAQAEDKQSGECQPASAAKANCGAGEAIFEECAEIALEHVGAVGDNISHDSACRDIADGIRLRASNRKTMDAMVKDEETRG